MRLTDGQLLARLSGAGISRSWLGDTGATESQISALEQRIARSLPPSYRAFLTESNVFQAPDVFIPQVYSAEAVDWVRHADWAQAFRDTYPHLDSCLQVSAVGDRAVILLNPNVGPEWQTYFFANWILAQHASLDIAPPAWWSYSTGWFHAARSATGQLIDCIADAFRLLTCIPHGGVNKEPTP
jgi:hypothetical protein